MMGRTHVAGGFLFGSAASLFIQRALPDITYQNDMLFCISTALFSSMCARLPDIDEKNSTIGRRLWFLSWPIYLLQLILMIPSLFGIRIFKRVSKEVGHRGFTHYPSTWLLITVLAAGISGLIYRNHLSSLSSTLITSLALSFSFGILSHLIYDFVSGKIKLFGPISLKEYGISLVKCNSILEKLIWLSSYVAAIKLIAIYYNNIV